MWGRHRKGQTPRAVPDMGGRERYNDGLRRPAINQRRAIFSRMIADRPRHPQTLKTTTKTTGLRYWMAIVLEECEHVAADFSADPVHDLRVSLRRCRSLADGMIALDPDRDWKAMKKAGKRLFQRLGALRDVQVMMEWIEKLAPRPGKCGASLPSTRSGQALPALPEEAEHTDSVANRTSLPSTESQSPHDPAAQTLLQILQRPRTRTKSRSPRRSSRIRPQTMEAMEQVPAPARRSHSPRQRRLQTSRPRALDRRPRTPRPRPAQPLASRISHAPHRHQTLPLHRRKFSPRRTQSLEQRPQAHARLCSVKSTISTCCGPPLSRATFSPTKLRATPGTRRLSKNAQSESKSIAREQSAQTRCGTRGAPACPKANRFRLLPLNG